MPSLNRASIIGYLGQDPEIRYNTSYPLAILSVATTDKWKDKKTGEYKTKTEWHRVTVFGNAVSFLEKNAQKGTLIYLEGKIQTRTYKDTSGNEKKLFEIVVSDGNTCQLLTPPGSPQGEAGTSGQDVEKTSRYDKSLANSPINQTYDDDIPW